MSYFPMSWAVESHFLSNTRIILNNDQYVILNNNDSV